MDKEEHKQDFALKARTVFLLWPFFALTQILLAEVIAENSLHEKSLTLSGRLGLQCAELSLLFPALFIFCLILYFLQRIFSLVPGATGRVLRATIVFVLSLAALVVYLGDWLSLYMTGQFSGMDGIAMVSGSAIQMFQHLLHFNVMLGLLVPIVCMLFAFCLYGISALLARIDPGRRAFLMVFVLLCFSPSLFFAWTLEPKLDKEHGQGVHIGGTIKDTDLFPVLRDYRTGPLLRIRADIYNRLEDGKFDTADFKKKVVLRPRGNAAQYFDSVNRPEMARNNVIIILVESLRPDVLVSFGGRKEVMPELDRLARRSQLFLNNYTQASHSNYADSCILSSQYPLRARHYHLYPKNPLYPRVLIYDILSGLGYRSAIISSQNESWGQMRNFLDTGNLDLFLDAENYDGPTYVPRADTGFANFIKGSKRAGKIDDRFTIDRALNWINADTKPFFAYINMQNSHVPYEVPADFPRRFSPAKLDFQIKFNDFPKDRVEEVRNVYFDSLAYVDRQIGRLFEYLERKQLLDKTIIVVSGDNGQAFFEHGFAGHANKLYDEVLRVPLLIFVPGLEPKAYDLLSQHIDVPPSLLELLKLPPHPNFQGRSLFEKAPVKRNVYLVVQSPLAHQYALVTDHRKLIFDYRTKRTNLYNLHADPGEMIDLARYEPQTIDIMKQKLFAWRAAQLDYYESAAQMVNFYPPYFKE